ncbi:hypothetical protein NLX71_14520 [Paenibacillus sp. MZ04-78.2]|uniref:hypothetical protein n=1 Tax=Paenibacillus sp. MZ04-78.2 TaxID=2962034 RepID=UPI0020B63967|nr:hypothetical protein [Paenibacillus sp. MZ04-78.2]MCP3774512.1 hypothetical protein [Paenibacillus sp. MZ04-78.2]
MTVSETIKRKLEDEKDRILSSFSVTKQDEGFIVDFIADCDENSAESVLETSKNILRLIIENSLTIWPSLDEWSSILPKEFVKSFADSTDSDDWTLSDWLYWFEPENRTWFLWNIELIGNKSLKISILVYEHPFPWEALEVLFVKLGTGEVKEIDT